MTNKPITTYMLKVEEVAEYLGVSSSFIRSLIRDQGLPVVKIGSKMIRIDPKSLNEWLENNQICIPSDTGGVS